MAELQYVSTDFRELVSSMDVEEKAGMISGQDFWSTKAVDRLSIPSMKMSDGPNGARGALFKGSITSACFPASVCLAATFDKDLVRKVGESLAEDAKSKSASVLLGPTVCPHRDPRGGRNFESFSEDPFLAGELAAEYINGLQSRGIGACIKHFAVNEVETRRFTIDCQLSQRALREIYLKPFEIAIKKSRPWALMTSYNRVNGTHADMNGALLSEILRNQWGFEGLVMSDWGGTNSTVDSIIAGLDLEMPGPGANRSLEKVIPAVKAGNVPEQILDQRVKKVLGLLNKVGTLYHPGGLSEQAIDRDEDRRLIRQVGGEGMVLLKNDQSILPLELSKCKSIAMIGLAKEFMGHGGGSAAVNSHHRITPWQAMEEACHGRVELRYAEGADIQRNLDPMSVNVVDGNGKPGWTLRTFTKGSGEVAVKNVEGSSFQSMESADLASISLDGTFTPDVPGSHYISFATVGLAKVTINDELVFSDGDCMVDFMAFILGVASEVRKQYTFDAGQSYDIHIESHAISGADSELPIGGYPLLGISFGFKLQSEVEANLLDIALETAKTSDIALIFVGNTPSWETEGSDRKTMDLPMDGSLDRLIAGVAEVNPKSIVVNSTGSPISMPWISEVPAILQAWFPGQEAGYSIVDVLTGATNPSGKLPVTYPKFLELAPSFGNFPFTGPETNLEVIYKEHVLMGYRYYAEHQGDVQFPFGFGLSYSETRLLGVGLDKRVVDSSTAQSLEVRITVQNIGDVSCSETLQVYVGPKDWLGSRTTSARRVKMSLAAFAKVKGLAPKETRSVTLTFDTGSSIAYWNELASSWVVDAGTYCVYAGTSSAEKDLESRDFELLQALEFGP